MNLNVSYKNENNLKIIKIKYSEAEQKTMFKVQDFSFFEMLHNIEYLIFY